MHQPEANPQGTPVFVFGALRSGTTVFRLMLDGHPEIQNPGEVDFLFDFLRPDPAQPGGWRYDLAGLRDNRVFQGSGLQVVPGKDGLDLLADFLDQYHRRAPGVLTLNIHRNVARALEVLPGARIIHMLRDPRDVARSSIGMGWSGTLYYGVNHWMRTETEWQGARAGLTGGQVHAVKYENLFRQIEEELRGVCAFLGVEFDDAMLDYHLNSTYAPPDPSLVEQWRHKSTAHEIALVEGKVAGMMRERGYEPAGAGHHPGAVERAWLYLTNRLSIWRTGVRRFGFVTYFMEKLTRYFRMEKLHRRLKIRMREQSASYIK